MIPQDFHFAHPQRSWFLLAIPFFFFLFFLLFHFRKKTLEKQFHPRPFLEVVLPTDPFFYWLKVTFFCLCWFFSCLALMEPIGNGYYPVLERSGEDLRKEDSQNQDIIFLVDASLSMTVLDAPGGKNRLDYAKEIIEEMIKYLRGQRLALYVFTSEITALSPLTYNYFFVRAAVPEVKINEGGVSGTDIINALKELEEKYLSRPITREKFFLLFSDGGDKRVEETGGDGSNLKSLFSSLNFSKNPLSSLICVGIGKKDPQKIPNFTFNNQNVFSSLESEFLKSLCRNESSEHYFEAYRYAPQKLADEIVRTFFPLVSSIKGEKKEVLYNSYLKIPLFFALVALIFYLFLPETRKKKKERVQ